MSVCSLQLWLYLLLLPGVSLACSAAPIAFEFCVELCFPVQEGTIGIWLTVWFNVAMALSFGLFQVINNCRVSPGRAQPGKPEA